jgi:hypothetical protein
MTSIRISSLLIIILISDMAVFSQRVRGTILDKNTHNRIPSALVYISGTFVRTTSDREGNFELEFSEFETMPVTISADGYYSVTFESVSSHKPLVISLKPKIAAIEQDISGRNSERVRKENLRRFRNTFLGTTPNGRNCIITNEDDISFMTSSESDTLKAYSHGPLLIENPALGYRIAYYLDEFLLCKKNDSFQISGNLSFTQDYDNLSSARNDFKIRRYKTYSGSRM